MSPKIKAESSNYIWVLYLAITLLAILFAYGAFLAQPLELIGDAAGYFSLGERIARDGLANYSNALRTYGYPVFISLFWILRDPSVLTVSVGAFVIQLAFLLAVCWYASRFFQTVFKSASIGLVVYAVAVLNPYFLIYSSRLLTDVPSAVLLFLATLLSLQTPQGSTWEESAAAARSRARRSDAAFAAVLAFFLVGFAVMLRPANLALVPVVAVTWILRAVAFKDISWRVLLVAGIALCLPFVPQLIHNYVAFGVIQPLIVSDLASNQALWGLQYLKYATLHIPGAALQILYENPFLAPNIASPIEFALKQPIGFLATLGAHIFALFDHSFPFPYTTDLRPWYRWPLSLLNYTFLFVSAFGIVRWLKQTLLRRRLDRGTLLFAVLLLASIAYLLVYISAAVENRYSLPVYFWLIPFFVVGSLGLKVIIADRRWQIVGAIAASLGVFLASCVFLSNWLQAQAPALDLLELTTPHSRSVEQPLQVRLGERMEMSGYTLEPSGTMPSSVLWHLTLVWECLPGMIEPYELQAELIDAKEHLWWQGSIDVGYFTCPSNSAEGAKEVGGRFSFTLPPTAPSGEYRVMVSLLDKRNDQYLNVFNATGYALGNRVEAGTVAVTKNKASVTASQLPIEHLYFVDMQELRLIGYTSLPQQVQAGGDLHVGIYWRARAKPRGDYVVVVQLRGASGDVAFEQSARPADGAYPTTQWNAGEVLLDWHDFVVPNGIAVGDYDLVVLLFEADRRAALGEAKIATVTVTRQDE